MDALPPPAPVARTREQAQVASLFDRAIVARASREAFQKLNPITLARNPVIFVTEIVAALTTVIGVLDIFNGGPAVFSRDLRRGGRARTRTRARRDASSRAHRNDGEGASVAW